MIRTLVKWVLFAFSLIFIAKIVPGIAISGFVTALIAALVIGLINILIKPIISILTLPINIITLGLFTLVINAALFALAAYFVPGFEVSGIIAALIGSVLFSILSVLINMSGKLIPV